MSGSSPQHEPTRNPRNFEHGLLITSVHGTVRNVTQDEVFDGIRGVLGDRAYELDIFRLRERDPAARRY